MSNERLSTLPNFEARKAVLTDAKDKVKRMVDNPCGNDWSPRFQLLQQPKSIAEKEAYLIAAVKVSSSLEPLTQKTIPALERQISKLNTLEKYADVLRKSAERREQGLPELPEEVVTTAEAILSSLYSKGSKNEQEIPTTTTDTLNPDPADKDVPEAATAKPSLSPVTRKGRNRLPFTLPGGTEIFGLGLRESAMLSLLQNGQTLSRMDIIAKVWCDVGGTTEPEDSEPAFRITLSRLRKGLCESAGDKIKINVTKSEDKTSLYSLEGIRTEEPPVNNPSVDVENGTHPDPTIPENNNEAGDEPKSADNPADKTELSPMAQWEQDRSIKLPNGKVVQNLSKKEAEILTALIGVANIPKSEIINKVWGEDAKVKDPTNSFYTSLSRLREKMAAEDSNIYRVGWSGSDSLYSLEPSSSPKKIPAKKRERNNPSSHSPVHGRLENTLFQGRIDNTPEVPAEEEKKI